MRIAVVEFAGRGGLIHYAFQLCRALANAGCEVSLLTDRHYELEGLPHPFRVEKILRLWDPKPSGSIPPSPAAAALRRLRRAARAVRYYREWGRLVLYLRRERPDVVQFGDIRFATDVAFLAVLRLFGLRLADICHNVFPFAAGGGSSGLPRASRLLRILFARIYRCFDVVFVHFQANRREFLEAYGLPPGRVECIPHGNEAIFDELKDPSRDPEALRRELGLGPEDRVVLLFGTLSGYKGVDVVLHAFGRVLQAEPRARLVVAGFPAPDFDLRAHEFLARKLGVEQSVLFVPRYVDSGAVAAWMALAEVAVFPYRAVYQSGALHVAQFFGVPVVATRVGAIPEVIDDGESGLLVAPGDPEALAQALLRLLDDPDLALRLGRRAREDALGRFAWKTVAETILDRYRGLIAPRADGAPGAHAKEVP